MRHLLPLFGLLIGVGCTSESPPESAPAAPPASPVPEAVALAEARWIGIGATALPESNQVSIEQDLALAREVFGPGGRIYYGPGGTSAGVQVLEERTGFELLLQLGELFSPRGGRYASYRKTRLAGAAPGTADDVRAALEGALAAATDPLLVYVAGHGDMAEVAADNLLTLWRQSDLRVHELAELLDHSGGRPAQFVITTCYSGGFAELVFRGADPESGPAPTERCGLFAATWDLPATGCDPNPDRHQQSGYGLHFLRALQGRDRRGEALAAAQLDLDGDGSISLLEAHTRARAAAQTADVPTTTSERWLRFATADFPAAAPSADVALPEEEALIRQLNGRPPNAHDRSLARATLERYDDDVEAARSQLEAAGDREDLAYRAAAADLLARWPVLDDPFHPDFQATLTANGAEIQSHLDTSPTYAAYLAARNAVNRADSKMWEVRTEAAQWERLVRAIDNTELAGKLKAKGGDDWQTYQRLLQCERRTVSRPGRADR